MVQKIMAKTFSITDKRGWVVSGSAFGKRGQLLDNDKACLTHLVDWENEKVFCGKVKFKSMLDDLCLVEERPSCPACLKILARVEKNG